MYYFNQLGFTDTQIINDVLKYKPNNIYLVSDTEWVCNNLSDETLDFLKDYTTVNFIIGSYQDDWYKTRYKTANTIHWNTFWFNWAECCLNSVIDHKNIQYQNFHQPFIFLNNKNNPLRCAIIDNLAKLNILDKGVVTWNKFMNASDGYQLKYYDNSFRSVDDDFYRKQDSFIICKEYYTALFHVVGESTNTVPFITEKTVVPILFKKPFVVMGCKGFNKKLKELGFELFDELIDYSFDDIESIEQRGSVLADNITKLVESQDLNQLYKKLYPKIQHNYERALEIINDINHIPEHIRNRIDFLITNKKDMNNVESRWSMFINRALS